MEAKAYDIIILGGGPGGYVAAVRAAQLGLRPLVVEREHLGGICLNWGCIPTKALLRTAEVYRLMQHLKEFGLAAERLSFDLEQVVTRSRQISQRLSQGIQHLMKKNKVDVWTGEGKLSGKSGALHQVTVTSPESKTQAQAPHVILATGARPRVLPGFESNGENIWNYRDAMVPKTMPKRLLIVGSGAIGIEFASFYKTFGVDVTVAEVQPQILPVEDEEIAAFARKSFEKQGIHIETQTTVEKFEKQKKGLNVFLKTPQGSKTLEVDCILTAIGIVGNTENLGLEKTKVRVEKGHIQTKGHGQTDEPGIYAIGDVAGPPWLAHKASHEGVICVEGIAGLNPHPLKTDRVPGCTYSHPQIASVGMTEKQAHAAGHPLRIGRFPFLGNGKAIALGEDEGLVKVIFHEKTGELLGAHMVGAEVTELIQGYAISQTLEATEIELMHTVFPHPTLSEMMHEAVLDAYGKALHK
ncbi:MAG: dihydrolipoyl dehydrogenase [Alphaproteobacteria bacterium]